MPHRVNRKPGPPSTRFSPFRPCRVMPSTPTRPLDIAALAGTYARGAVSLRASHRSAALLVLLAAGCGATDDDATPTEDAGADVGAPETGTDAAPVDDVDPRDPTPDPSCPGTWMVTWTGRVELADGSPYEGALAQMCLRSARSGELVCLRPFASDASGEVEVLVPESERCVDKAAIRIFGPEEGLAEIYCEIPLDTGGPFFMSAQSAVLWATEPPVDLPPFDDGRTPRTVDFGGGLTIRLVPSILDIWSEELEAAYATLGARVLTDPSDRAGLCFLPPDNELDGVLVFTPTVDVLGRPFAATFPNAGERAPGTRMELLLLGGLATTLDAGQSVREGEWRSYGIGTVSEDGSRIESQAAIHAFTWYGWRPAAE